MAATCSRSRAHHHRLVRPCYQGNQRDLRRPLSTPLLTTRSLTSVSKAIGAWATYKTKRIFSLLLHVAACCAARLYPSKQIQAARSIATFVYLASFRSKSADRHQFCFGDILAFVCCRQKLAVLRASELKRRRLGAFYCAQTSKAICTRRSLIEFFSPPVACKRKIRIVSLAHLPRLLATFFRFARSLLRLSALTFYRSLASFFLINFLRLSP